MHLGNVDNLLGFVRWIEARLSIGLVGTFGEAIPMVSLSADRIAPVEAEFIRQLRLVRENRALIMSILTAEIVDVVQWLHAPGTVDNTLLHHLVSHATDLDGGTHELGETVSERYL